MKTFILIILLSVSTAAQNFSGRVVAVSDSDTISVVHSDGNVDKVRILGIDAPEVAHNSKEISQPFAEKCRDTLKLLVGGKQVFVETERRDSYGRNLGRILYGDLDAGLFLTQAGCAWSYYPNGLPQELREQYLTAFMTARANKVGLFAQKRPITPSVWRKRRHIKRSKKQ